MPQTWWKICSPKRYYLELISIQIDVAQNGRLVHFIVLYLVCPEAASTVEQFLQGIIHYWPHYLLVTPTLGSLDDTGWSTMSEQFWQQSVVFPDILVYGCEHYGLINDDSFKWE